MYMFQLWYYIAGLTSVVSVNSYITRMFGDNRRDCIPVYDCPPGHEILPCPVDFDHDICQMCVADYVQPEYLSSTVDPQLTKCFSNRNEDKCREFDIAPSRTKLSDDCPYCKCNTSKCYYGNPCNCSLKPKGCPVGETLYHNGTCIRCPNGTWKSSTGCGHCFHVQSTDETVTTSISSERIRDKIANTTRVYTRETTRGFLHEDNKITDDLPSSNNIVIIFVSVISGVTVLLLILTFYCWYHSKTILLAENNRERADVTLNNTTEPDNLEDNTLLPINAPAICGASREEKQYNHDRHHQIAPHGKPDIKEDLVKHDLLDKTEKARTLPDLIEVICKDERHDKEPTSLPLLGELACKKMDNMERKGDRTSSLPLLNVPCSCNCKTEGITQPEQTCSINANEPMLNAGKLNTESVIDDNKKQFGFVSNLDDIDINRPCAKPFQYNSIDDNDSGHAYKTTNGSDEQLSENLYMPVRQVSENDCSNSLPINQDFKQETSYSLEPPSSGYYSDDVLSRSPMSADCGGPAIQEYGHLVSSSDRTERTESITSGLENYDWKFKNHLSHQLNSNTSQTLPPKNVKNSFF